jgi:hypothetical protein
MIYRADGGSTEVCLPAIISKATRMIVVSIGPSIEPFHFAGIRALIVSGAEFSMVE